MLAPSLKNLGEMAGPAVCHGCLVGVPVNGGQEGNL